MLDFLPGRLREYRPRSRGASGSLRGHFDPAEFGSANCADEIYAGHVAEHMDDVKASFGRWFEVLKPGGRITITVPDCRGANRMWLERKRFPALELGPDEGIIAITTE